jgi:hypothetical protein
MTVLLLVQDSDAIVVGLLAVALFGLLLTAQPAALFLFYSRRQPPPQITRETRTAIYFSAITLVLFGALLLGTGGGADIAGGIAVAALGMTTIVRALWFTPPTPTPTPPSAGASESRLGYGRSSVVGAFLFLLVAVLVPKFGCGCGNKDQAYQAMMKSDLRNLVTAEAAFFADHGRYAPGPELQRDRIFFPTTGDSLVIAAMDTAGWRAVARHVYRPDRACGIWVGVRPSDGMYGATEGEVRCWQDKSR